MTKYLTNTFVFAVIALLWIFLLQITRPLFITDTPFGSYYTALGTFFFSIILAPLWEELIFRYVPIKLTAKIHKNTGHDYSLYAILISSTLFAVGHGNGQYSILLQGILGVGLCYLFILNKMNYWYNVLAHALWNAGVYTCFRSSDCKIW